MYQSGFRGSEKLMEDVFNKTIQGPRFLDFRKFIMNE